MSPAQQRALAAIQGELGRLARYDDESIVNDLWVRRRYDGGPFAHYREDPRRTRPPPPPPGARRVTRWQGSPWEPGSARRASAPAATPKAGYPASREPATRRSWWMPPGRSPSA